MKQTETSGLKGTGNRPARLVSIITVVFRAREDLPGLIESVARIKDENTEFIVIDGGSDDGTAELLERYGPLIDYWVSEPDKGIYDAMNKGIAVADGTFIFHLNAGDRLLYIPIQELKDAVSTGVAAFRVSVDGRQEFRPSSGLGLRVTNTLHHQGTFYRRDLFPGYDLRFQVFADFDVNQRLALSGVQIDTFDHVVAMHCSGGISDTSSAAIVAEFFSVIAKNYGRVYIPVSWMFCKWRGLRARMMRKGKGPMPRSHSS